VVSTVYPSNENIVPAPLHIPHAQSSCGNEIHVLCRLYVIGLPNNCRGIDTPTSRLNGRPSWAVVSNFMRKIPRQRWRLATGLSYPKSASALAACECISLCLLYADSLALLVRRHPLTTGRRPHLYAYCLTVTTSLDLIYIYVYIYIYTYVCVYGGWIVRRIKRYTWASEQLHWIIYWTVITGCAVAPAHRAALC